MGLNEWREPRILSLLKLIVSRRSSVKDRYNQKSQHILCRLISKLESSTIIPRNAFFLHFYFVYQVDEQRYFLDTGTAGIRTLNVSRIIKTFRSRLNPLQIWSTKFPLYSEPLELHIRFFLVNLLKFDSWCSNEAELYIHLPGTEKVSFFDSAHEIPVSSTCWHSFLRG